jgi:hypothetical protein
VVLQCQIEGLFNGELWHAGARILHGGCRCNCK